MDDDGRRLYGGQGASFAAGLVGFGRGEVDCGWLLLLAQFLHTARERDYSGGGLLLSHWLWGAAYS